MSLSIYLQMYLAPDIDIEKDLIEYTYFIRVIDKIQGTISLMY